MKQPDVVEYSKPFKWKFWGMFGVALLLLLLLGVLLMIFAYYRMDNSYSFSNDCQNLSWVSAQRPLPPSVTTMPVNLTVAFVGDSGVSSRPLQVYALVLREAELLIHLGDFDYCDRPNLFGQQLSAVLGAGFPILATVGNHDIYEWATYEQIFQSHSLANPNLACEGYFGVNYWCMYKGLFLAFSAIGTMCGGTDSNFTYHEIALTEKFNIANTEFPDHVAVCAWHRNEQTYSPSGSPDETGFGIYDVCRQNGALTFTAHSHIYGRTYALNDVYNQNIGQSCNSTDPECIYQLTNGTTIIVNSGMGGQSNQDREDPQPPYWAQIVDKGQGVTFCKFNYNGNPKMTYCYWKNVLGEVLDEWKMLSQ